MSVARPLEVIVVSAVRLHRDGLCELVDAADGVQVWGAVSGAEGLEPIGHPGAVPEVAILDVAGLDAVAAAKALLAAHAGIGVVAVGLAEPDLRVLELAEAGVLGFLTREAGADELVLALEHAARGEVLCSPAVATRFVRRLADLSGDRRSAEPPVRLTARELEIAELVAEGLSNKQIARHLCIELATAKNHVHHILEKLDLQRRGQVGARLELLRVPAVAASGSWQ